MSTDQLITILSGVAIASLTVWAVEYLAERRSRRDRQLEALDQTARQLVATMADVAASLAGPGASGPGRFDADAYPRADARLVGDIGALREFYTTLSSLHVRAPGTGIHESDLQRVASANNRVRKALTGQEDLVLERKPIRTLNAAEVVEYGTMVRGVLQAMHDTAVADEDLQQGGMAARRR